MKAKARKKRKPGPGPKAPRKYSYEYMDERIQYLDMICLLALHQTFGFGAVRLRRYYNAIWRTAQEYNVYLNPDDPDWGKVDKLGVEKPVLYALRRDLAALGFDYDRVIEEEEAVTDGEEERENEKEADEIY